MVQCTSVASLHAGHYTLCLLTYEYINNVILPQSSIESDFWTSNFCSGPGSNAAWHYHGLEKISLFPPNLAPFNDGPIYTIVNTNPKCISSSSQLFGILTHEMVEALTDPYPIDISIIPPHIQVATENEIADICEPNKPAPNAGWPFAFTDPSGNSPSQGVQLTTYWSNAQQNCVSFSDVTQPSISSAGMQVANFGPNLFLSIPGSGFGSVTNPNSPVTINDNTDGWQAGNLIDQNAIQFSAFSLAPSQIAVLGMTGLSSFHLTSANASLTIWVCNPNSLKCTSAPLSTPANPSTVSFAIETSGGDFLSAINGGGIGQKSDPANQWAIHTDATTVGAWERFRLFPLPGGAVGLATLSGFLHPFLTLVSAIDGGGIGQVADPTSTWPIHTDKTTVGPWERLAIVPNQDGTVSIMTPDGVHYFTAVNGGGVGQLTDPANRLPIHTDSLTTGAWEAFTLVPLGLPLSIVTTQLNPGRVGSPYSSNLSAKGGTPRYTWTLQSGSPPPGLAVNADGTISGINSKAGTFQFTIKVQDSATPNPATATQSLSATFVAPAPPCPAGEVQLVCNSGPNPVKRCVAPGSTCPTPTCGPNQVLVDGQCVPKGGHPQ